MSSSKTIDDILELYGESLVDKAQQAAFRPRTIDPSEVYEYVETAKAEAKQSINIYIREVCEEVVGDPLTYTSMNLDEVEGSYDDAFEQGSEKTVNEQRKRLEEKLS